MTDLRSTQPFTIIRNGEIKVMGIQALHVPDRVRTSKYAVSDDDIKTAKVMLKELKSNLDAPSPGDGPFRTQGMAQAAGNAFVEALGTTDIGVSVWADGETETEIRTRQTGKNAGEQYEVQVGDWYFTLKHGRRKRNVSKNGNSGE